LDLVLCFFLWFLFFTNWILCTTILRCKFCEFCFRWILNHFRTRIPSWDSSYYQLMMTQKRTKTPTTFCYGRR
jgi:hypothetical protein